MCHFTHAVYTTVASGIPRPLPTQEKGSGDKAHTTKDAEDLANCQTEHAGGDQKQKYDWSGLITQCYVITTLYSFPIARSSDPVRLTRIIRSYVVACN